MGHRRRLFALVLVVVIGVTGGAAVLLSGTGVGGLIGSEISPSVVGVIVRVESEGLDRVRGFTLRTDDGTSIAFTLGALENGALFPPGHLAEHQATAEHVRVSYRTEGQLKVATRIDDAP